MTESRTLLIEIGTEDLPAELMNELAGFQRFFLEVLEKEQFAEDHSTSAEELTPLYTPRRLAVKINDIKTRQPEKTKLRIGPPATRIDPDDPAVRGFAKSCRADVGQLEINNGRLCCNVTTGGQPLQDALPSLLLSALSRIDIKRRMRWGAQAEKREYTFARPIRWLCILHGRQPIEFDLFGVRSGNTTYGHRFHCPSPLRLDNADEYERTLKEKAHVIVNPNEREEKIRAKSGEISKERLAGGSDFRIKEAIATTEWPQVLDIDFDKKFLSLPPEVITQALETGLKAFVKKEPGSNGLSARIGIVSDVESKDPKTIKRGYEKVARARLEDAQFFFERDKKTTLESRRKFLGRTLFQEHLGTLEDKSARLTKLVEWLAPHCDATAEHARRAARLCKCDLGTDVVGEYPTLQGTMGGYYAEADGENTKVATAIKEHYLPHGFHDVPKTPESVALAIADKIDTLAGFWRIGLKPSSSRDPYGLGRAVEALLLLLIENQIDLSLTDLIDEAMVCYDACLNSECPPNIRDDLFEYIFTGMTRIATRYIKAPPREPATAPHSGLLSDSVANAVPEPKIPHDFVCRLKAIATFIEDPTAGSLIQANKRIGNILKNHHIDDAEPVVEMMSEPAERALLKELDGCREAFDRKLEARDYANAMKMLAGLRESVDRLFDETLIMAEDSAMRDNRLALLKRARRMFLRIADFSLIHMPSAPD